MSRMRGIGRAVLALALVAVLTVTSVTAYVVSADIFHNPNGTPRTSPLPPAQGWSEEKILDAAFNETRALVQEIYAGDGFSMEPVNPLNQAPPIQVNVTVIGRQEVSGSWQAGYNITYTGIRTVVIWMFPLNDTVINATVVGLADHLVSVGYASQDKEAIGAVLANSTFVGGLGMGRYYVERVEEIPTTAANMSFAGDAFVYLKEVDGHSGFAAVWDFAAAQIVASFNTTEQADLGSTFQF